MENLKMKPILITTPRTGSNIICEKIYNISKLNFNYVSNLNEFFNINDIIQKKYFLKDSIIQQTEAIRVYKNWAKGEKINIQLERLEMLRANSNYMIKMFPINIHPAVEEFVTKEYDLIFLERKNKIKQFLSYLALFSEPKQAHNEKNNSYIVKKINFRYERLNEFLWIQAQYEKFKEKYKGKTIFYEDLENSMTEENLAYLLNLKKLNIVNYETRFTKTEYEKDIELIIENNELWQVAKVKHFKDI